MQKKSMTLSIKHSTFVFASVAKKAKYEAPNLEKWIPKSSINKAKSVKSSSPSIVNLVMATTSKSVGLIMAKGKIKSLMEVA